MTPMRVRETLRMAKGEVRRVIAGPGTAIRVGRGRVWLTEFGGGRDWSLACGATHAIAGRGIAVIESMSPAVVEVLAPAPWWRTVFDGGRARMRREGLSPLRLCVCVARSVLRRGNPA